jgi:hypothetical protein
MIIENIAKVLDIAPETVDSIADADVGTNAADSGNCWRMWTIEEAAKAAGSESTQWHRAPAVLPTACGNFGAVVVDALMTSSF